VTTAYLGLGSNRGDRLDHLRTAITELGALAALPGGWAVSPLYATEPVGGPADQGPYLNCVLRLETSVSPHELLQKGLELEEAAGRVRSVRFGPRQLDVDLLLYGDERIDDPDLVVPHPRMFERAFVLVPLLDLDPSAVPVTAQAVLAGGPGTHVRRIGTLER
jgi:2-amino-4-hydroxy-6-hydroxymethyldihydropteridine diphosphokinase